MADEALAEARALFTAVHFSFEEEGILRIPRDGEERARLAASLLRYPDVEEREGSFFIKSGMTIDVPLYLNHLWLSSENKGAKLHLIRVQDLDSLSHYDAIILCAGANSLDFTDLAARKIKGQLLVAKGDELSISLIGKGYIAKNRDGCILGSTYERVYATEEPDRKKAEEEILPKIATFFPAIARWKIRECRAGLRLARRGHYYPIVRKIGKKRWVCTALGSRGLLYHAFLGKMLASAVMQDDENLLRRELR